MLQRSEGSDAGVDCDDPVVALACSLDTDECPAACKEGSKEDDNKVVKSGDLAVTAKAADGRKALIGGVSDLDTITFKTSEDVTISSITLERYGYSTIDDVETVQLEDEDGNIIADAKEPNSKGQVKLTLKKDYKTVDGTFKATVVVKVRKLGVADTDYADKSNGSTLGFKVIAAESTAKNLNLDDYSPYTYDLVNYAGSSVQFSSRNSETKDYNFEAGELYEVAKFRVKAPSDATILVRGFTLTDDKIAEDFNDPTTPDDEDDDTVTGGGNAIDADKYTKDVKVTVNGKEVSGLKWNINKDDELVISFSEVEVAGKETATIAVSMSFTEEFDKFGNSVQYYIKDLTKFNAIDKKTETRVSDPTNTLEALRANKKWTAYKFKGGKTKLSGTKLGVVSAAAGSSNIKVAEGNITITEAIRGDATITLKNEDSLKAIDEIRLVINGEEYDGTKASDTSFKFKGVEIEKSGKVEIRVDLKDADDITRYAHDVATIEFDGSLNSESFRGFKYDESGELADGEITGSLSISNIRIQAAKASLTNKTSKKAELVINENNRKTIFEGTYEAKKGAVTLKNFVITSTADDGELDIVTDNKLPTFYVTINKDEYDAKWSNTCKDANGDPFECATNDIDDIEVADGKSVDVKVEIEYTPKVADADLDDDFSAFFNTFNIVLEGEDEDNNSAGRAEEESVRVEVVKQGTIDLTNTGAKKTILLKSNKEVAEFTIKPSKTSEDEIILNNITFVWDSTISIQKVRFDIDGDYYYSDSGNPRITQVSGNKYQIDGIGTSIPSKGSVVKVTLRSEAGEEGAEAKLTISEINGKKINSEFSKYYVPATVKITQNNGKGKDNTQYTAVFDNDTSYTISNLYLMTDEDTTVADEETKSECQKDGYVVSTLADHGIAGKCIVASKSDLTESEEGNKLNATNVEKAHTITTVAYKVNDHFVVIKKADYENFFENAYSDDDLMVYSNKS